VHNSGGIHRRPDIALEPSRHLFVLLSRLAARLSADG